MIHPRTRIKICGLTREQDIDAAVAAGADAVGFVLYERSPRHVSPARMAELVAQRDRALAPPTFPAAGLYFLGPQYDPHLAIPRRTAAHDWLPRVPVELARPDEAYPFVSGPAPKQ